MSMFYKCTQCSKTSWARMFRCPVCGGEMVGFEMPKIQENDPAPTGMRLVLVLIGAGVLFGCLGLIAVLGFAM